ncbi:hypothetical protein [Bradyrhizobium sp.]|uniref:hypothetical protein n=1 Tax=Bradyrhizobium sp. TaxID=376 RepID=UPI002D5B4545|nr:hypothetical protein [Bradyrhizobium sp.]HZR71802.1 hypothetical protein [Bradyrhizobium sp.]
MSDLEPRKIEPQNTRLENTGPEKRGSDDAESEGNRAPAMAGLAIAVVLLVVGLWLAHELTAASKMQDCLMSGRTNCNVIQPQ